MAIIIGTDANGYVTYVNQPDVNRTLFENIKDVYPEEELKQIKDDLTPANILDGLKITPGVNCETATITKAIKTAKVLYMQVNLKPSTNLTQGLSMRFTISGLNFAMDTGWILADGLDYPTTNLAAWVYEIAENGDITIQAKHTTANSTWSADKENSFSLILPLTQ